jgi:hypothetical protein
MAIAAAELMIFMLRMMPPRTVTLETHIRIVSEFAPDGSHPACRLFLPGTKELAMAGRKR